MDFGLTDEQKTLVEYVGKICERFPRSEWLKHAHAGTFPADFWDDLSRLGVMGIPIPEKYAGSGLGMFELILVMEAMSVHGVPLLLLILGPGLSVPILVRHGSPAMKEKYLPGLASGERKCCFAVTEPTAGTNTFAIETRAESRPGGWVINGQKAFISGADVADYMLLVARTSPYCEERRREGLSLFLVEMGTPGITLREIETRVVAPERQFMVYLEDVFVDDDAVVGEVGRGAEYLFAGLNGERMMVAAMAVGLGRYALDAAARYAGERSVFGRPIGAFQGLQHPLALAKVHVELAALMNRRAAWAYDRGEAAGAYANMAKLAASDAALEACDVAIQVFGGNGLSAEYGLMDLWSLCRLTKTAPVSREMVLNYIGERVLGLPKSYSTPAGSSRSTCRIGWAEEIVDGSNLPLIEDGTDVAAYYLGSGTERMG